MGNLRNWAGNVAFSTEVLHRPASIPELQEIVSRSRQVRALGSGHSFNRIADTAGALISVAGLPRDVTIDMASATAEVPAGASYAQVSQALEARGWALPNLASLPHISVAGACCTGTHGSGAQLAGLASHAVGVEFVRADGELVRVDRSDPAFPGSVLTLGALGIMTRLRLAVVPSFTIKQTVWVDLPLASAAEHFDAIMTAAYSVSMFRDWTRPGLINALWLKSLPDDADADAGAWGARPGTGDPSIGQRRTVASAAPALQPRVHAKCRRRAAERVLRSAGARPGGAPRTGRARSGPVPLRLRNPHRGGRCAMAQPVPGSPVRRYPFHLDQRRRGRRGRRRGGRDRPGGS